MLANFDFASMPDLAAPFPAVAPNGPLMGSNDASSSSSAAGKPPIPLACVACRSKHLKCTGGEPCSRCATDGSECSYVKSRRGYKGPRKRTATEQLEKPQPREPCPVSGSGPPTTAAFSTSSGQHESQSQSQSPSFPALDALLTGGCQASSSPTQLDCFGLQTAEDMAIAVAPKQATPGQIESNDSSMATSAFFTYFAAAHPFLLPRTYLLELVRNKRLPHLELAMQFIGSCYLTQVSTQLLEDALSHALAHQNHPKDGFMVQTLLLYAIGLKSNDKWSVADEVLNQAIDMALGLGMNDREFSIRNGSGSRMMEESWRRTWWELYVVDGFFAGVSHRTRFRLWNVPTDVPLPCEETEYESGYIPSPRTLEEYDDAVFADEEIEFSSFAVRIDAVRNLGRVLAVTSVDVVDVCAIESADSHVVNWTLHLPASKRDVISHDGHLDHMLFQAHMITNSSTILLHKPRSTLDDYRSASDEIRTCARPCSSPLVSTCARETHTAKCLDASRHVSQLVRLPTGSAAAGPVTCLTTPFFTCAVVMSSVVYLSAWALMAPSGAKSSTVSDESDAALKELIRLNIGALKELAGRWPLARSAAGQVRGVAGELFRAKREVRRLWSEGAAEDILWLIEDAAAQAASTSGSDGSGCGATGGSGGLGEVLASNGM